MNAIEIKAVGVTFPNEDGTNRQELLKELRKHDPIQLVEEPWNVADPNAIAIKNKRGEVLGYVGKNDPNKAQLKVALGVCEVHSRVAHVLDYGYASNGKRYSIGLRVEACWRLQKDGDYDRPVAEPTRKNSEQKPKRKGNEWRDEVKRRRKARLTYQEIQAIKERRSA